MLDLLKECSQQTYEEAKDSIWAFDPTTQGIESIEATLKHLLKDEALCTEVRVVYQLYLVRHFIEAAIVFQPEKFHHFLSQWKIRLNRTGAAGQELIQKFEKLFFEKFNRLWNDTLSPNDHQLILIGFKQHDFHLIAKVVFQFREHFIALFATESQAALIEQCSTSFQTYRFAYEAAKDSIWVFDPTTQSTESIQAIIRDLLKEDETHQTLAVEVRITYELYLARYLFKEAVSPDAKTVGSILNQWKTRLSLTDPKLEQQFQSNFFQPAQELWSWLPEGERQWLLFGLEQHQFHNIAKMIFKYSGVFVFLFMEEGQLSLIKKLSESFQSFFLAKTALNRFSLEIATFLLEMRGEEKQFLKWKEDDLINYPHLWVEQTNDGAIGSSQLWEKIRYGLAQPQFNATFLEQFPISHFQSLKQHASTKGPQLFSLLLTYPKLTAWICQNGKKIEAYATWYADRACVPLPKNLVATSFGPNPKRTGRLECSPPSRLEYIPARVIRYTDEEWLAERKRRDQKLASLKQPKKTSSEEEILRQVMLCRMHNQNVNFIFSVLKARQIVAEAEAEANAKANGSEVVAEVNANGSEAVAETNANGKQSLTEEIKNLALRPVFFR